MVCRNCNTAGHAARDCPEETNMVSFTLRLLRCFFIDKINRTMLLAVTAMPRATSLRNAPSPRTGPRSSAACAASSATVLDVVPIPLEAPVMPRPLLAKSTPQVLVLLSPPREIGWPKPLPLVLLVPRSGTPPVLKSVLGR